MIMRSSGLRRRVWIAGLAFLMLITGLAVLSARAGIESGIRSSAAEALVEAGYGWLDVEVAGRQVILNGAVFSEQDKEAAEAALRDIWGVGDIESRLKVAVRETPYVFSVSRSGEKLRLRGSVPSEEAQKTIVGLLNANFSGMKIDTKLRIDPNMAEKDRWLTGVGFALSQLKNVSTGNAVLADADLSFEGIAIKPGAYESLMRAFHEETPDSITVAEVSISPPKAQPFTWKVQVEEGDVILAGHAPSEMAKATMIYHAQKIFPDKRVIDNTTIAKGEPDGWWIAARVALRALEYLRAGSVTLAETAVSIEGIAKDFAAQQALSAMKGAWPAGFELQTSLRHSALEPAGRQRLRGDVAQSSETAPL
jgi:hypothetical protein